LAGVEPFSGLRFPELPVVFALLMIDLLGESRGPTGCRRVTCNDVCESEL
jgi:hypothetical protein